MGGFGHHFADRYGMMIPSQSYSGRSAPTTSMKMTELCSTHPRLVRHFSLSYRWQDRARPPPKAASLRATGHGATGSWELTQVNETPFDVGICRTHGPAGAYNFPGYWGTRFGVDAGDLKASVAVPSIPLQRLRDAAGA